MAGNTDALVDGPATIYVGALASTELTDAQETALFAKGADGLFTTELDELEFLRDGGYTSAALALTFSQTTRAKNVQQVPDPVVTRRTTRGVTAGTTLAEGSLENLAMALDATVADDGTSLEPNESAVLSEYPVVVEGWAPNNLRRRFLERRAVITDNVAFNYDEANDTGIPVVFTSQKPKSGKKAWRMVDEKAPAAAPAPAARTGSATTGSGS